MHPQHMQLSSVLHLPLITATEWPSKQFSFYLSLRPGKASDVHNNGLPKDRHLGLQLHMSKKLASLLNLCVSSLRRGHANLLSIVPILTDDPRRESNSDFRFKCSTIHAKNRILGNTHAPLISVEKEVQSRAGCTKAKYRPSFSNKKCGIKSMASNIGFCPPHPAPAPPSLQFSMVHRFTYNWLLCVLVLTCKFASGAFCTLM